MNKIDRNTDGVVIDKNTDGVDLIRSRKKHSLLVFCYNSLERVYHFYEVWLRSYSFTRVHVIWKE